jgi:hypothetical protein
MSLPRLNKKICDLGAKGWCDQLGKHPKNYLSSLLLAIVFQYGLPVLLIIIYTIYVGRLRVGYALLYFFSPVFPSLVSLYFMMTSIAMIVLVIIFIIINTGYLIYMTRQLGIYILIPVLVEATRWIIMAFFPSLSIIAIMLSLLPVMPIAVGAHFAGYSIEKGIIVRNQ